MIKDAVRQTSARIWHSGPHTGTRNRIQPHTSRSVLSRVCPAQSVYPLVVAGSFKLVQISPRLGVMVGRKSVVIRLADDAVRPDGSQIGSRRRFRRRLADRTPCAGISPRPVPRTRDWCLAGNSDGGRRRRTVTEGAPVAPVELAGDPVG